jgi:hypothetical protein
MSHLVNQRMDKRQPMCWSSEGAHLLLQVRCAVLDQRLDNSLPRVAPEIPEPRGSTATGGVSSGCEPPNFDTVPKKEHGC